MFSRDAKDEIASVRFEHACCPATFVCTLAHFAGSSPGGSRPALRIASQRASVARAVIAAAHLAGIDAKVLRASARKAGARWSVIIPSAPKPATQPLPKRRCCRRVWLRAAFLTCGSVSDPARGYHLEFFCRDDRAARSVCQAIASFGADAGVTRRRGRPLAYLKDAQTVSALLGYMGASRAVLRLEAQRALRQTKNSIRRTVNSEAANAARAALSAARQRKAAMRAISRLGLGKISPALQEAAALRIAHPAQTLRELAKFARPPITKAAMASRLRLLERLAGKSSNGPSGPFGKHNKQM